MRTTKIFAALLLAHAGLGYAALGGLPAQFGAEGTAAVVREFPAPANYSVRETTLATGTRVREYIASGGTVFAVAWNGPALPDLKSLLGRYFDALVTASARTSGGSRSYQAIDLPEVVIHSGGRMRAFEGSAWIPGELPAGFAPADVR